MINFLLFIPACFAINLAFGPNNLLAITHGANHGVLFAARAGFGRLMVFIPMIIISGLGLGAILSTSAAVFFVIKVVGAAYLIWLGIKLLRNKPAVGSIQTSDNTLTWHQAFKREALVAVGNPKAILVFAAFFRNL